MTALCCLQLSLPENEILEPFSEDLRVPETFSWLLWLFRTFVGRKSLKWNCMTVYNQKWSCSIGVPVDPHFLFIPQEDKLFLRFNLITISVIHSLTKTLKIQHQASVLRRWQAQRQLLCTISKSCPLQSSPFTSQLPQPCEVAEEHPQPSTDPLPALPAKGTVLEQTGTLACLQVKNVPLPKPDCQDLNSPDLFPKFPRDFWYELC